MILVVFILSNCDLLPYLISDFSQAGIKGATIISSTGMGMMLSKMNNSVFSSTLNLLFDPAREDNKTIFLVTGRENLSTVKKVIYDVVGDLSTPDTGVLFTLPVLSAEGCGF